MNALASCMLRHTTDTTAGCKASEHTLQHIPTVISETGQSIDRGVAMVLSGMHRRRCRQSRDPCMKDAITAYSRMLAECADPPE